MGDDDFDELLGVLIVLECILLEIWLLKFEGEEEWEDLQNRSALEGCHVDLNAGKWNPMHEFMRDYGRGDYLFGFECIRFWLIADKWRLIEDLV